MSSGIDRVGPTLRPDRRVAGFQQWRSLLFMHWSVSVDQLRGLVPPALELDLFEGRAYVGLVPFLMRAVRPSWLPSRAAFNFFETNLRTYVVHRGRPGVYFFSLDASSRIAVNAARSFWGLPYFYSKMSDESESQDRCYQLHRVGSPVQHRVRYRLGDALNPAEPDTLEFYFLERYLLFVQRLGQLYAGQVHHKPYPTQLATVVDVEDGLITAAGFSRVDRLPDYAHFSTGVDVEVFGLQRLGRC